ncbi:hypothetical protein DXG01_016662, partial [Tephrocybe rancida]
MGTTFGLKKDREFGEVLAANPDLLASEADVRNFCTDDDAPGPDIDNPQIFIEEPLNIWNIALGGQFYQVLLEKFPERRYAEYEVVGHFINRVEALRKALYKHRPRFDEEPEDVNPRLAADLVIANGVKRKRTRQRQ